MPMQLDIHINAEDYLELGNLTPGKKYRSGLLHVQYDPEKHVFSYTINNELFTKELQAMTIKAEADAMRVGVDFTDKHSEVITRVAKISLFGQVCKHYAEAVEDMMRQLATGYAGVSLEKVSELLGVSHEELSSTLNRVAEAMNHEEEKKEESSKAPSTQTSFIA
jgi:hypothetical protein